MAASFAPKSNGVVLIADAHMELLLVTHGVIHDEVSRILVDPRARANGAAYFRYIVTAAAEDALRLADEMFRTSRGLRSPRLRFRDFPDR